MGQVSLDGRKWSLGKEKTIVSHGDWNEKWNMKGSQKPIQMFIILSRISRLYFCGKGTM